MTDTPEIAAIRELLDARKEYANCPREGDAVDRAEARLDAAWASLRALLAAHDARESVPSVEVRAAVALAANGEWSIAGWSGADDGDMAPYALRELAASEPQCSRAHTRIITARVPLPQSQEIRGMVEHG